MIKSITTPYKNLKDELTFQRLEAAGFDGIDLGALGKYSESEWKDILNGAEDLKRKLEKHHLKCAQLHLPYYDLFKSSELSDAAVEKNIINSLKLMNILDCKWGAYHPRSSTNFNYDSKRAMEDNKREISMFLEEAIKQNVGIAVENIPIFPDCPQYRFFSADFEEHLELVDSFKSEHIGVCWDFGHANLMPYDMCKMLLKFGERIKIVHIHNNFRTYDLHLVPTLGTIDWKLVIPTLKKIGFTGPLNLELNLSYPTSMPETLDSFFNYCGDVAKAMEKMFNE